MITLPLNFIATTTAYVGSIWADLTPVIILVFGLPLAFWVIRQVIGISRF